MKRFEVYCPAGWAHVELDRDPAMLSRSVAAMAVPGGSGDTGAQLRGRVARHLEGAFAGLAQRGVWSVMLPVAGPTAIAVRPTIAFAPLTLPPGTQPMDGLVALAAADPSAEVMDIDPLVALRTSRTDDVTDSVETQVSELVPDLVAAGPGEAGRPSSEDEPPRVVARRVRYVLGDVEDPELWADVSFSLTHLDDDEQSDLADAAVEAFDALVKTFRWRS